MSHWVSHTFVTHLHWWPSKSFLSLWAALCFLCLQSWHTWVVFFRMPHDSLMTCLQIGKFFFSPELSWLKSGKSTSSFFTAPYRPWIDLEVLQTLKIGWPSNGESKRLLEWAKLQGKIRQAQQTKLWAVQTYPRLLKQVKAHTWRTASFPELSKMSLLILSGNKQFSSFQCSDTMAKERHKSQCRTETEYSTVPWGHSLSL